MTTATEIATIIDSIVTAARGHTYAAMVCADKAREAETWAEATVLSSYASEQAIAVAGTADSLHEAICTTAADAPVEKQREAVNEVRECQREATEWAGVAAIAVYQRREQSN